MVASGKDAMRWDRSGFAADLGKPLFGTVVMESKKDGDGIRHGGETSSFYGEAL